MWSVLASPGSAPEVGVGNLTDKDGGCHQVTAGAVAGDQPGQGKVKQVKQQVQQV